MYFSVLPCYTEKTVGRFTARQEGERKMYDLIIIGSGPAGLSAAIYAERAKLDAVTIEKEMMSGGQILNTYEVDNYPGLPGINGFDLGVKLREHAEGLGAHFIEDEVKAIGYEEGSVLVSGEKGFYEARTLIIASGAGHRKLGVPGEERLTGRGVGYCAVCDGALFRGKTVAVVGGGDVALGDAVFLSRFCEKIWLIHRRNEFRGAKSLQEQVGRYPNVEVIWDTVVEEILGEDRVESARLKNVKTGEERILPLGGVFVAAGILPNSEFCLGVVEDQNGFLTAGEDCATSVPGIFAAGDVRTKALRQIVTAAADGANAVNSAEKYLREHS